MAAFPTRTELRTVHLASRVRAHSARLVELDTAHGAADLWRDGVRAFGAARRQLAGRDDEGNELAAATGEAGEVAAWLLFDAARPAASRRVMLDALELSRRAGDREMELMGLSHLAMVASHGGNAGEALRVAGEAVEFGRLAPRVRALFQLRLARALAAAGHRRRALAAIGAARATLASDQRGPAWTWWLDEAELTWHEAMVRADLADWTPAVDGLGAALAGRCQPRVTHGDRAFLAAALVRVRAWRDAGPVLIQLADEVTVIRSPRTAALIRRTLRRIAAARAVPAGVADAAEVLSTALAGTSAA